MKHTLTITLLLTLICITGLVSPQASLAATPKPTPKVSPSPTPTPSPTPEPTIAPETIKENIQQRIEKVIEQQAAKDPTANTRKPKAFVGQIDKVTNESLFVKTPFGQEAVRLLPITVIVDTDKTQNLQAQDIALGSWAIVMGYLGDDGVMDARRIVISPVALISRPKKVVLGKVVKISAVQVIIQQRNNEQLTLKLDKKTRYVDETGQKIAPAVIKQDLQVLAFVDQENIATMGVMTLRLVEDSP